MLHDDPFFLVAPPPPMYAAPSAAPRIDSSLAEQPTLSFSEELSRAREVLDALPFTLRPSHGKSEEDELRGSVTPVCSDRQLAAMERITNVSEVFAQASPAADWLLMRPRYLDDWLQNLSVDDDNLQSGFVAVTTWSGTPAGHVVANGARATAKSRQQTAVFTPSHHLESSNCVLGTTYRHSSAIEESNPRISRFVLYLPDATLFAVIALPRGDVALERLVYGKGSQVGHESIVINEAGDIQFCIFGDLICHFCSAAQWRLPIANTKDRQETYTRCHCPRTMQERALGRRASLSFDSWESFKARLQSVEDYAYGVFLPNDTRCGLGNPWMVASMRVEYFSSQNDPITIQLRTRMMQSLEERHAISKPATLSDTNFDYGTLDGLETCILCGQTHSSFLCPNDPLLMYLPAEQSCRISAAPERRNTRKTCSVCGASFAQTGNLTRHMRRMHTKRQKKSTAGSRSEQLYNCNLCEASFDCAANLSRHKRVGHRKRQQ